MASARLLISQYMPALDSNGDPISGAKLFTYENGTTIPSATYSDSGRTLPNTNPVVANSAGTFGPMWVDENDTFTVSVTTPAGAPLAAYDNVSPVLDANTAAAILAENAAGVAVTARDDALGYSGSAEDSADAAALSAAQALAAAAGMGATPAITAIGVLTPVANRLVLYTSASTAALLAITPYMQEVLGTANQADLISEFGLGSISTQDADDVLILGGQVNAELGGGTPMAAAVTTLSFPAVAVPSADPNTIDDYEEADYTPTVTAGTTAPTGATYTTRLGSYTKVGRLVVANIRVRMANLGAGGVGDVRITLPFTALKDAAVSVGVSDNTTGIASGSFVSAAVVAGTNYIAMRLQSANSTGQLAWSNLTNSWEVFLTVSYFAT